MKATSQYLNRPLRTFMQAFNQEKAKRLSKLRLQRKTNLKLVKRFHPAI